MSRLKSILFSSGLIGAGVLAAALAGRCLTANADLNAPLNPLGIRCSPYGEVIAMAMQGPIDTFFEAGMSLTPNTSTGKTEAGSNNTKLTLDERLGALLTELNKAGTQRTNPTPASPGLKRHLRRQAEDKLRFAYQLDPANYANYNALHFFLTEPQVGTRPELTPSAAKLAEDTIQYCLKQSTDPRPALTAAAASTNILHLMFNDQQSASPKFNLTHMRQYLAVLDHCITRYLSIAHDWDLAKNWDNLSPLRIAECNERLSFICKIRDAAAQTIHNLEQKSHSPS
jgi:hypothetical protein